MTFTISLDIEDNLVIHTASKLKPPNQHLHFVDLMISDLKSISHRIWAALNAHDYDIWPWFTNCVSEIDFEGQNYIKNCIILLSRHTG